MDIVKKSLQSLSVYGASKFVVSLLSLASMPFLSRMLSHSQFAFISLVILSRPFFYYISSLDISQATSVFFADTKSDRRKKVIFSTGLIFTFLSNLTVLIAIFVSWNFVSKYVAAFGGINKNDFILVLVSLLFGCINYFCMMILRWQDRRLLYCIVDLTMATLLLFGLIAGYSIFNDSARVVFISWVISFGTGATISFLSVKNLLTPLFSTNLLKKMLRFSMPLCLNNIPLTLNSAVDRYLVLWVMGVYFSGVYAAAYALVPLGTVLVSLLNTAIWPIVYKAHNDDQGREKVALLYSNALMALAFVSIVGVVLSKPMLNVLLSPSYVSSTSLQESAPILLLATLISALTIFFPGIAIARKNKLSIIATLVSLLTNIFCGLILAKLYGILGVSIACLLASIVQARLYMTFSQRYFKFKYLPKRPGFVFVCYAVIFSLAYFINLQEGSFTMEGISVRLCFIFLLSMIMVVTFRKKHENKVVLI